MSRSMGISQGDLPHTRETTYASRMQGDCIEQHCSHSLNRWKERSALLHRHAGKSARVKPYTLRGILGEGVRALMTRLSPSLEEGTGTQPDKIVSFQFVYITQHSINVTMMVTMYSIERTNLWLGHWPNMTYINKVSTISQCVQSRGGQLLSSGQWPQSHLCIECTYSVPNVICVYSVMTQHQGDNLPLL